jgi:hypothetical protein
MEANESEFERAHLRNIIKSIKNISINSKFQQKKPKFKFQCESVEELYWNILVISAFFFFIVSFIVVMFVAISAYVILSVSFSYTFISSFE